MRFVFLVDTSPSMQTLFDNKISYIETARSMITAWIRARTDLKRSPQHEKAISQDSYAIFDYEQLLLSTDDMDLVQEIALSLQIAGESRHGAALQRVFNYCSCFTRADAMGYYPDEEGIIIYWITDADSVRQEDTVNNHLIIHGIKAPGAQLYQEPFRWNHRLFPLILVPQQGSVNSVMHEYISNLAIATGGFSILLNTLNQSINCILNSIAFGTGRGKGHVMFIDEKIAPYPAFASVEGCMVNFEYSGEKKRGETILIHRASNQVHFPIPEPFWPPNVVRKGQLHLEVRKPSRPTIYVRQQLENPGLMYGFPVTRHRIQQTPEIQKLAETPSMCWSVYVRGSGRQSMDGHRFGYLKKSASESSTSEVYLYALPYNYPRLFSIIDVAKRKNWQVDDKWKKEMQGYLASIPVYYWEPVRNALNDMKIAHLCALPRDATLDALIDHSKLISSQQPLYISNLVSKQRGLDQKVIQKRKMFDLVREKAKSSKYLTKEEQDILHTKPCDIMGRITKENVPPLRQVMEAEQRQQKQKIPRTKIYGYKIGVRLSSRSLYVPPLRLNADSFKELYHKLETNLIRPMDVQKVPEKHQVSIPHPDLITLDSMDSIESVSIEDMTADTPMPMEEDEPEEIIIDWPTRQKELHQALFVFPGELDRSRLQSLVQGLLPEQLDLVKDWAHQLNIEI
ncbi:hypothetical protein EDD86DRAFT_206337, partial [Gorgonomyces haynaldii]